MRAWLPKTLALKNAGFAGDFSTKTLDFTEIMYYIYVHMANENFTHIHNQVSRQELLREAGISSDHFAHLKRLGLVGAGTRKSRGRGRGVQAFYPRETISKIREIEAKVAEGVSLKEQARTLTGKVDALLPATLDRGWVIIDFKRGPGLTDADTSQMDVYLEALLACGFLGNKVHQLSAQDRDLLEFPYREFTGPALSQLSEWIAKGMKSGLGHLIGVIGLESSRIHLAERMSDLQGQSAEGSAKKRDLLNSRLQRVRAAIELVTGELARAEG